jgi:hypothetical protein
MLSRILFQKFPAFIFASFTPRCCTDVSRSLTSFSLFVFRAPVHTKSKMSHDSSASGSVNSTMFWFPPKGDFPGICTLIPLLLSLSETHTHTHTKWQEREVNHSSPSSAEVKNAWICTFSPPYVVMARCSLSTGTTLHLP